MACSLGVEQIGLAQVGERKHRTSSHRGNVRLPGIKRAGIGTLLVPTTIEIAYPNRGLKLYGSLKTAKKHVGFKTFRAHNYAVCTKRDPKHLWNPNAHYKKVQRT